MQIFLYMMYGWVNALKMSITKSPIARTLSALYFTPNTLKTIMFSITMTYIQNADTIVMLL